MPISCHCKTLLVTYSCKKRYNKYRYLYLLPLPLSDRRTVVSRSHANVTTSFVTFISAVSVKHRARFADWNSPKLPIDITRGCKRQSASFSSIFDIVLKFVIVLQFAMSVWSSPGCFNKGVTRPCFSDDGNTTALRWVTFSLLFSSLLLLASINNTIHEVLQSWWGCYLMFPFVSVSHQNHCLLYTTFNVFASVSSFTVSIHFFSVV